MKYTSFRRLRNSEQVGFALNVLSTHLKLLHINFTRQENFDRQNAVQFYLGVPLIDRYFLTTLQTLTSIVSSIKNPKTVCRGNFVETLCLTGWERKQRESKKRKIHSGRSFHHRIEKITIIPVQYWMNIKNFSELRKRYLQLIVWEIANGRKCSWYR